MTPLADEGELRWLETDLSCLEDGQRQAAVAKAVEASSETEFSLDDGSLVRFHLMTLAARQFALVLTVHHIVCDGWSLRVLLDDLAAAYQAFCDSSVPDLKEAESFAQFSLRSSLLNESQNKSSAMDFWLNHLEGLVEPARLPPSQSRPPVRTYNAASQFLWLDDSLAKDLLATASAQNVSLFSVMLSLFSLWMSRLSGEKDVVVGVPVAGQPFFDMSELVGHCANMLPYRCQQNPDVSFSSQLRELQSAVTDGYENQAVTFGEVLKHLPIRRDASLVPLVPVTLNVVSASAELAFGNCQVTRMAVPKNRATFELTLDVYRDGDRLQLEAIYNKDLFSEPLMSVWLESFATLARSAIAKPDKPLSTLAIASKAQYLSPMLVSRDVQADFDLETSLPRRVAQVCAAAPNKPAIVSSSGQLSFAELDEISNKVANFVIKRGVKTGDFVGVCLSRSEYLPAFLLGIMRSGAAYLPIDPMFPPDRRAYILADSGAPLIIAEDDYDGSLPVHCQRVSTGELLAHEQTRPVECTAAADDRAYVIYTSGSTGNPKGVEVSHRNLMNFLQAMQLKPGMSATDRLLAVTSISFDISLLEMFLPMLVGGTQYFASAEEGADGTALKRIIEEHSITLMQGTPSSWRLLLDTDWTGSGSGSFRALCGGEPMPAEIVPAILDRGCELWNMYGPTETTVWSTLARIESASEAISIGTAVANNDIHILDASLQHCLPGVVGEICIGGDGVTLGYLGLNELTSEKFVPVLLPDGTTERLYRTGDLGLRATDGRLYHQGRMDFQLKVRGYRMEAGEIEACLTEHDAVEQAVVDAWPDSSGEKILIAYLRTNADRSVPAAELRSHLAKSLPGYMIPQRFEWQSEFPLTPNGKVDRKQLRPAENSAPAAADRSSTKLNHTELAIAKIWQSLIGGEMPEASDTFFEIGGHSLLAVRAIKEINEQFSLQLPVHRIALEELSEIAEFVDKHTTQEADVRSTGKERWRWLKFWQR
ncbi:MAG: amino acid adenylation domain-containing protein [Pseudomonadota bacterium]